MTCTPTELASLARCYEDLPAGDISAIWIMLLCSWAEKDVENPQAPCQETIINNGNGTITLNWVNPVAYDSIEIIHTSLTGGFHHIEDTINGNSTNWTTPILDSGDYFLVRGVIGDDFSGFAYIGPCDGR